MLGNSNLPLKIEHVKDDSSSLKVLFVENRSQKENRTKTRFKNKFAKYKEQVENRSCKKLIKI